MIHEFDNVNEDLRNNPARYRELFASIVENKAKLDDDIDKILQTSVQALKSIGMEPTPEELKKEREKLIKKSNDGLEKLSAFYTGEKVIVYDFREQFMTSGKFQFEIDLGIN